MSLELQIKRRFRLGIKGPRCTDWLRGVGLPIPQNVFDIAAIEGGRLIRAGLYEYILEGSSAKQFQKILQQGAPNVYPIEHQEICLHVLGDERDRVLAQTCGLNPDELEPGKVYYTRAAGAPVAMIVDESSHEYWVDPSLAHYLEETFHEIISQVLA